MSADNFIAVRKLKDGKWAVKHGNASTGHEFKPHDEDIFDTRDEAIKRAGKIQQEEIIEYGLAGVDDEEEMSALDKINGCIALLVDLCIKDTNADSVTIETSGLTYKGDPIGDYQLIVKKVKK